MSSSSRTFVALPIPDLQRTRLGRLQGLIAPEIPGATWVEPRHFHATLVFLGDIPDTDLARVCRAVGEVAKSSPPLSLNLQSLGAFPDPASPRVAWVGLRGPDEDGLHALREAIAVAVTEAGYPPQDDRFTPHVTLGRIKAKKGTVADLTKQVAHFRMWSAGTFTVDTVVTLASTLTPEGPDYMSLARASLSG
jgi:2'-5' RNA ligase